MTSNVRVATPQCVGFPRTRRARRRVTSEAHTTRAPAWPLAVLTLSTSLLASACHGSSAPPQAPDARAIAPAEASTKADSLERLTALVTQLSTGTSEAGAADPQTLAAAFRALGDALRSAFPRAHLRGSELQHVATKLESHRDTAGELGTVRQGLTVALEAFVANRASEAHREEYRQAVDALAHRVARIDAGGTFAAQSALIESSLRAATDAAALARGAEPPFGDVEDDVEADTKPPSITSALEDARLAVELLAQSRWARTREASARALESMANALRAADCSGGSQSTIHGVAYQGERLRRGDPLEFGQARWVKQGLSTALDALGALTPASADADREGHLLESARGAINGIRDAKSLSFQRAAIQDAFRATLSALTGTLSQAAPCPRPDSNAPNATGSRPGILRVSAR